MKILMKLDNENIINQYFVLEYNKLRYIRTYDVKSKKIKWEYGLSDEMLNMSYPDEMNEKKLEFLFNKCYRKEKLERIIK